MEPTQVLTETHPNVWICVWIMTFLCIGAFILSCMPTKIKSDEELWGRELEEKRMRKDHKRHY